MTDYLWRLNELLPEINSVLLEHEVDDRYIIASGEIEPEKIRVPSNVNSEFLINREMGDWAESLLSESLAAFLKPMHIVPYGEDDKTPAGVPGFKERYVKAKEETWLLGKKPDLLIFLSDYTGPVDLRPLPRSEADYFARKAALALEVRSSKQKYFRRKAVIDERALDNSNKASDIGLNFTIKLEDLRVVYRWIENLEVPQAYVQVFFDAVFLIDVSTIFSLIASGNGFKIKKERRSQNKPTIYVPIDKGRLLGAVTDDITFDAGSIENNLGTVTPFVKPMGGRIQFQPSAKEVVSAILRVS